MIIKMNGVNECSKRSILTIHCSAMVSPAGQERLSLPRARRAALRLQEGCAPLRQWVIS
jgi:hypothetical protein